MCRIFIYNVEKSDFKIKRYNSVIEYRTYRAYIPSKYEIYKYSTTTTTTTLFTNFPAFKAVLQSSNEQGNISDLSFKKL